MTDQPGSLAPFIELDPERPGLDEARLAGYYIPVWAIIGYLEGVGWDVRRAAQAYGVPVEAVEGAITFYRQHAEVIDARIDANTAA